MAEEVQLRHRTPNTWVATIVTVAVAVELGAALFGRLPWWDATRLVDYWRWLGNFSGAFSPAAFLIAIYPFWKGAAWARWLLCAGFLAPIPLMVFASAWMHDPHGSPALLLVPAGLNAALAMLLILEAIVRRR